MFEMTLILISLTVLGIMAYEYSLNGVDSDRGEKAISFF